jgi:diguanylate cyclase (GGDEF)-like protein/hemerythrin-like metal-binding protein
MRQWIPGKFVESHATTVALFVLIIVYAADALAPPAAKFDIFYLVPIGLVAWYRRSSYAYWTAILAMLGDLHNSVLEVSQGASRWIAIYSAATTLVQFSAFCFVVLRIRMQFDQLKRAGDMLRHIAFHDRLTGLPNRPLLFDRFARSISQARRNQSKSALMVLDLDGFKQVNDRFGHQAGDDVLKAVAARLTGVVREVDTVARLGGDEFAVVVADIHEQADACLIADKILNALMQPIPSGFDEPYRIGASIGISFFPDDGNEIDSLLAGADEAMYASKRDGKNRYTLTNYFATQTTTSSWMTFHSSYESGIAEIDSQHRTLVELINSLNNAIKENESSDLVARKLDELIAYTEFHFSKEEALMRKFEYPEYPAHKRIHADLMSEVERCKTQLETPGRELVLLQTLKEWLVSHIEFSDKVMADYLKRCGA